MASIPTILITYNRPIHTRRVLDALKENKVEILYIFSDAPRNTEDIESVNAVRELIKSVDWVEPNIIYQRENQGLAKSITSAVDLVFQKYNKLILLEDDCVPQKYFFDYMTECLNRYENNKSVFGINGYTVPLHDDLLSEYPYDIYFYQRIGSWGWATWKDRWKHYNKDIKELLREIKSNKIQLNKVGNDIPSQIEKYLNGELKDVWTLNWILAVLLNDGYYIYPTRSHIENIGCDGTGLHSGATDMFKTIIADYKPERFPNEILLNKNLINNYQKYFGGPHISKIETGQNIISFNGSKKINICHINTNDIAGGAEKVASRLVNSQKKLGLNSGLLVCKKYGDSIYSEEFDTKPELLLKSTTNEKGLLYYEYQGSHSLIDNHLVKNADIVHIHNLHGGYFNPFSLLLLSRKKKVIWTLHDMQAFTGHCAHSFDCAKWTSGCGNCPDLTIYPSVSYDSTNELWLDKKFIYENSDFLLTVPSEWLKKKVENSILKNHRCELVYNGVDTEIFKPQDKNELRRKYKIPDNLFIIGGVAHSGALNNVWKGGEYTRAALEIIFKKIPNAIFLNIGSNSDSDQERIFNVPHVSDEKELAELYSLMDIYLTTSIADNAPLVVLEALSCGLPVVAFNTGGIPELVKDGYSGIISEYKNAGKIAEEIIKIYWDKNKLSTFANNARNDVLNRFDNEKVTDQYLKLYEELKSEKKTSKTTFNLEKIPQVILTPEFLNSIHADEVLVKDIINLSESLIENKDYLSARNLLSQTLSLGKENLEILNNLAVVDILENKIESAVETLNKVLAIEPNNSVALNNLKIVAERITTT